MRITFSFGQGPVPISGGKIMVLELIAALNRAGHGAELLTQESAEAWWPEGVVVREGDLEASGPVSSSDVIVTGLHQVERALGLSPGMVAQLCAGYEPHLWPLMSGRFAEMYQLPSMKAVVSPHLQRTLRREMGVESVLIGNPIRLARFTPSRRPGGAGPIRVLTVGQELSGGVAPVPFKGIAKVLEIVERNRSRGHRLELVRMTPVEDSLIDSPVVDELHVGVDPRATAEIYRSCDIYLGASTHAEGLGMPVFEAACSGLASVIPAIPSYRDVPALRRCALFYEPGDVRAGGEALARLLTDDALRTRLGSAGPRSGFQELFDPDAAAGRLAAALDEHLAGARST